QLRERAAGPDDAVPDQQRAVLGQRGRRVPGERVTGRVDHGRGVDGHGAVASTAARSPRAASSAAATATAITAGSLPVIPGWPIGQVIRAIISGRWPAAAS